MIRWMCGVTMMDRYSCEELQAWVGIKPNVDVMRQRRLRWFGLIERREDNSWLKKVQILAVDGHSGCGRPRKNLGTCKHGRPTCKRTQTSGDLRLHEQSNPCLHGIIMDLKTMMESVLFADCSNGFGYMLQPSQHMSKGI